MVGLVQHDEGILARLVDELRALYDARLVAAAVYGSVGRGTMRDDSDVDLMIVVRGVSGRRERRRRIPWKGAWYWDLEPDFKPGDVFEWP